MWVNRIVSQGECAPEDFSVHEMNFKVSNEKQRETLVGVLEEVGWVQSVIVNVRTGKVLDGHLRLQIAIDRGQKTVPVSYVDLDEEEERLLLLTLDPIRAMSLMDAKKHAELIESVDAKSSALTEFLGKLSDKRVAATSFLDGVIKRSAPKSIWKANTEEDNSSAADPGSAHLPLQFLLSYNDRQEMFEILNAVKVREKLNTMPEALMVILASVLAESGEA